MDVFLLDKSLSGPTPLRLSPLKTSRVAFSVYEFEPWQALGMHRHPGGEEVFYVVDGRCLFYVGEEARAIGAGYAVHIPEGAMHAVLSCSRATLLSVAGPPPVTSVYENRLEYSCPACRLETPLRLDARAGDMVKCPRCKAVLRLAEAGDIFEAVPAGVSPEGART